MISVASHKRDASIGVRVLRPVIVLTHAASPHCMPADGLNIGSVLFTPPLSILYASNFLVRKCFSYLLDPCFLALYTTKLALHIKFINHSFGPLKQTKDRVFTGGPSESARYLSPYSRNLILFSALTHCVPIGVLLQERIWCTYTVLLH